MKRAVHPAWKRRAAPALAALLVSVAAPSAWAFHAGPTFDTAAAAGGAEGIYYTGAPLEHGWKCDLCHQSPEGKITLGFRATPPLAQGSYTPGQIYKFEVDLIGEHLGLGNAESNSNSAVVEIVDQYGQPAGNVNATTPMDSLYSPTGASTFIPGGTLKGATHWTFNWFAPALMTGPDGGPPGPVTFYVAAIDGNGANAPQGVVLNDPFGDDFVSTSFTVQQGAVKVGDATPPRAAPGDPQAPAVGPAPRGRDYGSAPPLLASMLTLVAFGMVHRGRRRR